MNKKIAKIVRIEGLNGVLGVLRIWRHYGGFTLSDAIDEYLFDQSVAKVDAIAAAVFAEEHADYLAAKAEYFAENPCETVYPEDVLASFTFPTAGELMCDPTVDTVTTNAHDLVSAAREVAVELARFFAANSEDIYPPLNARRGKRGYTDMLGYAYMRVVARGAR